MNVLLWVLQVLLALHTLMGAAWKFANSEQAMGALSVIPHAAWLALSVVEILCAVLLVLPAFKKSLGHLVPAAVLVIAAEMLLYTGLHFASGDTNPQQPIYWLVVAAFCGFIAYGRLKLKPIVAAA